MKRCQTLTRTNAPPKLAFSLIPKKKRLNSSSLTTVARRGLETTRKSDHFFLKNQQQQQLTMFLRQRNYLSTLQLRIPNKKRELLPLLFLESAVGRLVWETRKGNASRRYEREVPLFCFFGKRKEKQEPVFLTLQRALGLNETNHCTEETKIPCKTIAEWRKKKVVIKWFFFRVASLFPRNSMYKHH